jgi:site-specific DNA-methyltransferase (adenine-specific)
VSFEEVIIGPCKLYRGDSLELLNDGLLIADVIVSDPPYGIAHPCNYQSRGRGHLAACTDWSDIANDDKPFDPSPWLAMGIPSVLWGGNYFANRLPDSAGWLVWDKERPDELDQSTCELAWTNCIKGVRRFAHLWNGMIRHSERGEHFHPMQKPVALARWILSLRWLPDGVVLDPYMGAGWIGVACAEQGREFIGCELSAEYFDIACRRIERAWELKRSELPFDKPEPARQLELV